MLPIATMKEQMAPITLWANILVEDFDAILAEPEDPSQKEDHHNKIANVFFKEFNELNILWKRFPESYWNNVKAFGRDMPEWAELRAALIEYRSAFKKIRRLPKKAKSDEESKSPTVPE